MKYLVTWHFSNETVEFAGHCRYYDNKIEAYNDFKHFRSNTNFYNVHLLEIQEKEEKENK